MAAGSADGDEASRCSFYCWWRSAPEFDMHGRPGPDLCPAMARDVSAMTPRARVLREMERLALLGVESLDDVRRKLLAYRPGDLWVPTGGVGKHQIEIPAIVSILVVGAQGSGKSSLVNLMYSVLGRSGLIPFAHTSPFGSGKGGRTRCLEEHNVLRSPQNGFCVFDTRGFEYDSIHEGIEEMADWIKRGVRHRQISRDDNFDSESRKYLRRRVNCAMVVVNISEIYKSYKIGVTKPLEATREIFSATSRLLHNEEPILVLTHGDELSMEERLEARVQVSKHLGVSETRGAYDIACLNEYGLLMDECDPVTAYSMAEAVYRMLLLSDKRYFPKRSFKDWLLAVVYWIMACLANFFAFLSKIFSQFSNGDYKLKFA